MLIISMVLLLCISKGSGLRLPSKWISSPKAALSSTRLASIDQLTTSAPAAQVCSETSLVWHAKARSHSDAVERLLYPAQTWTPSKKQVSAKRTLRSRTHLVPNHPIYNFLHNYYQYSANDLRKYSPGIGVRLEGAAAECPSSSEHLDARYFKYDQTGGIYDTDRLVVHLATKDNWVRFMRARDVLRSTASKPAFFGCFGLHEWAMLYSGNGTKTGGHQNLPLRVSQQTIDTVVGGPGQLRCTHYDAFRFFQPAARPLNVISPLSRDSQVRYEQPGCIHANMDLFRYAYTLYPFVSSDLLLSCLELALEARRVDMRASPYDVTGFEGCEVPICVETVQGRKLYVEEQERISALAVPLRRQLCEAYDEVASQYLSTRGAAEEGVSQLI